MTTDIESFIEKQWERWKESPEYLHIAAPYRTDCPPMWFIGGHNIPASGRPLVVLSLEPLVDAAHYQRQITFATRGFEAYCSWQLDYFDVFPTAELAGKKPQRYWRTMFELVAGFVGTPSVFDWRAFRTTYAELPLVPLHAPGHKPGAFRTAARVVEDLLHQRLRLVAACWPEAVLLCAGAAVAHALTPVAGSVDEPLLFPREAWARRTELGDALFDRCIVRRTVSIGRGKVAKVFVRRAPFSSGHQPTTEGLRFLGKILCEFKDEAPDTDRAGEEGLAR